MVVAGIECWNIIKFGTTRIANQIAVPYLDFLKCFQTVGSKARAYDVKPAELIAAELGDRVVGVWSQPLGPTDARLK